MMEIRNSAYELDDLGIITDPWAVDGYPYRLYDMVQYAKAIGKNVADLTDEEREPFRIKKTKSE